VAGAACADKELKGLPPGITLTTRLRKDVAPCELPPDRTGRRGRPRAEGDKLPSLARLAADAAFTPAAVTCLWYGPFSLRPGRAGNTPAAGCPPVVSAPDGHGMILIERCVDIEDATYRVIW
jgi:hypothetical protein